MPEQYAEESLGHIMLSEAEYPDKHFRTRTGAPRVAQHDNRGFFSSLLGRAGLGGGLFRTAELPSRSFRSMGTMAAVTLGGDYAGRIEEVTEEIRAIFDRLESEMSAYRPSSVISELSRMAGVAPVRVPEDTYRVLSLGQHFGNLTAGAFNIGASPLAALWGFNGAAVPMTLPSDQSVGELLELSDYCRLVLNDGAAFLPAKGMAVDVGGIAKGYAVDRAYDYCLSAGIRDFLIDFSGNVRAAGRPSRKQGWQIGVRDPFDGSSILGKITLPSRSAVSTSGSYERFVDILGERYSHIIDPRTGYPVTGTASVTVLCPDAVTADALSTAFFVTGLNGAAELLEKVSSVDLLLVPDGYPTHLWLTPGFDKVLSTPTEVRRSLLSCQ
ncbi:MAG TPA: FAD:protein FMN transferase [Terriglobia bacterium]|nr:FAD:protein FMN transferase [Terriglobia bacterium]